MKKMLIAAGLTLAVLGGAPAFAQTSMDNRIERMTEKLDLTPEQVQQVTVIMEEQKVKRDAIRETLKDNRDEMMEKMKGVLSEEQLQKMEEMKSKKKDRKYGRGKHRANCDS